MLLWMVSNLYSEEGREFFEAGNQFYQIGDMQEAIHYYRMAFTSFQEYGNLIPLTPC